MAALGMEFPVRLFVDFRGFRRMLQLALLEITALEVFGFEQDGVGPRTRRQIDQPPRRCKGSKDHAFAPLPASAIALDAVTSAAGRKKLAARNKQLKLRIAICHAPEA